MILYLRSGFIALYRLRKICLPITLKMVYNGIIHSKLKYAITYWGSAYFNKFQNVLIIQKAAIRRICGVGSLTHLLSLFNKLKILPLRQLFIFKILRKYYIRGDYLQSRLFSDYNFSPYSSHLVISIRSNTSRR